MSDDTTVLWRPWGARSCHLEHWIPAEEMDDFNRAIVGRIEVVAAYHGEGAA